MLQAATMLPDYGAVRPVTPHEPQVLCLDLRRVSALLEVSQHDLLGTLGHTPAGADEELHVVASQSFPADLPAVAHFAEAHLGTHFVLRTASYGDLDPLASHPPANEAASVLLRLSSHHVDGERDHGLVIPLGPWRESHVQLPACPSLHDLKPESRMPSVQGQFRNSMLSLLSPGHHTDSQADIAALLAAPSERLGVGGFHRGPSAFIVGTPGEASALVLPEPEDRRAGRDAHWELPSAMAEVCLVVESDAAHHPHVYAYIRYVQPAVAWALLAVGWAAYSAVSPIYSLYPLALQRASFRVAAWRNALAFVPFFGAFLVQLGQDGLAPEHRAFLRDPANWPLILAGSMGSFWASTTTLLAVGYSPNFCLVAVLSSMHPYLVLLLDRHKAHHPPGGSRAVAILVGGLLGAACMVLADHLRSTVALAWCAAASGCLVLYVKANYRLQALLPFPCLMSINFGLGALTGLTGTLLFEGTTLGPGPDSLWWALDDRRTLWVTLALSLSYMCGIASFVACSKHLPVLVVSVALALEPETSVVFEVFGGGVAAPVGLLLLGMALITATKLWLALASYRRKEAVVDVTDAVRESKGCFSEIPEGR